MHGNPNLSCGNADVADGKAHADAIAVHAVNTMLPSLRSVAEENNVSGIAQGRNVVTRVQN